ncbi:MAG: sodium:proton antiporter NhaD [Bacteroidales bacterium]|jgi:Na+/H+ antiporter NhaD/arsenite permease-like protein|nr:sodium:proton antiporter NhaD [Bacteroidales bacterium]
MFIVMVIVFVLGYIAIALEHPLRVDKAVPALAIGTLVWVFYILGAFDIFSGGLSDAWNSYSAGLPHDGHSNDATLLEEMRHFIVHDQIIHHLGEISEILFFLLGAMTIVEIIDKHDGFKVITDKIKTTKKIKLLWILSFLTFFMSAALDNLTTTIVMVALLRKLISDKQTKWFFASMIVLAANAGGAWSPIGDVTTIMLWIGGQVTAGAIISKVILPSLVTMVVPLAIVSITMKGYVTRPEKKENELELTTPGERILMLVLGISGLLFVPVFKSVLHLPPYMGMLLSLSAIWLATEIMHQNKPTGIRNRLSVITIVKSVEMPTIFFFLGILSAVAALQSAGQLGIMATFLDDKLGNIFLIDMAIGVMSSIVDNVPLVAGAMGMYPIEDAASIAALTDPAAIHYAEAFMQDGLFWEFLAYCAGTGGSILIIGSAAGVAAMGMEKIDFIWYLKKISWLAFIGYIAGAGAYYLQSLLLGHV